MIRIDEIRALHHDLHMRPFEGDRRVYLIFDAHRMNDEAAAALLKDLEEPPAYATLVLVADELGSLPETIRSRCQLVPFRRLSRAAPSRQWLAARAPELRDRPGRGARAGRRRPSRPRRAAARRRRARPARGAARRRARRVPRRGVPSDRRGGRRARGGLGARAAEAREREQQVVDGLDLPTREAEQRVRRAGFGAEQDEILASLDDLGAWYRDLVLVAAGAEAAVVNADRLDDLRCGRRGRRRPGRGGRRGDRRASGVARGGGVQPQRDAAARGAVRPPAARVQRRTVSRTVKRNRSACEPVFAIDARHCAGPDARQLERHGRLALR